MSDLFIEDYVGGAELTSQALIDSSPYKLFKLHSKKVSIDLISENSDKFWIFGNFAEINSQLIVPIIQRLNYSVLEYDYKYCKARSPEKHMELTGLPCDCHNQDNGKLIAAFYQNASHVWWMSQKQKERYVTLFPFLNEVKNTVLSSVFDDSTLEKINQLNRKREQAGIARNGWVVLGSSSWVKGFEAAKNWCELNNKKYEVVWNIPYDSLLEKLSTAEGFVYLPAGGDTCPRMVIEAKLLGCKLQLNENVQHKDEFWFDCDTLLSIQQYLSNSKIKFWNGIKQAIEHRPSISGYTTVLNCIKQQYPFEQCIKSMLGFCKEVCVVDGGSNDGTWEKLLDIADKEKSLKIKQVKRDWSAPNHPIYDGLQKAEARSLCTSEFCWQMDSDEIVHEEDYDKILKLCSSFPKDFALISLPVIEYWCSKEKVRCDIQPWKWRLSRNFPNITHGIPKELRQIGIDGLLYALPGTDGCDMIDKDSKERIIHATFYSQEIENARQAALHGNEDAKRAYQNWFNEAVKTLPCVFHYSWFDMPRKIQLYRDYWQNHWRRLYDQDCSDTAENNMFFDVPWSQVSDKMILNRAKELSNIGGWIWHSKWNGKVTPWIVCNRTQPKIMQGISK